MTKLPLALAAAAVVVAALSGPALAHGPGGKHHGHGGRHYGYHHAKPYYGHRGTYFADRHAYRRGHAKRFRHRHHGHRHSYAPFYFRLGRLLHDGYGHH